MYFNLPRKCKGKNNFKIKNYFLTEPDDGLKNINFFKTQVTLVYSIAFY